MKPAVSHNPWPGNQVAIPAPGRPAWTPPAGRPPRVLLVRLSALGDLVHALPTLSALRQLLPEARVDWVVEDRFAPLLEGHPDLGRVVAFPRRALGACLAPWPRPLRLTRGLRTFLRTLREGAYDLALDLQGNLKSGLIARGSGARVVAGAGRAGSREGNHLLLTRRLTPPPGAPHRVERNLALLGAALGRTAPFVSPRLPLSPVERAAATEALAAAGLAGRPIVLHPGTSGFGAFKRWPPERYGALAQRLGSRAEPVVVTFGPGERDLADAVARASAGCAAVVPTPSLRILAALLKGARLVVAGDTGPLHLAALMGTPVLGIYGPKDPAVYGPYGLRPDGAAGPLSVVTQPDVACRPCTLRRCDAPLCLTTLSPDRVLAALRS